MHGLPCTMVAKAHQIIEAAVRRALDIDEDRLTVGRDYRRADDVNFSLLQRECLQPVIVPGLQLGSSRRRLWSPLSTRPVSVRQLCDCRDALVDKFRPFFPCIPRLSE